MTSEPRSSSKGQALTGGISGYSSSSRLNDAASHSHDIALLSSDVDTLRITEIDTDSQALVAHSQGSSSKAQLPHHTPNQRSITYSHESVEQDPIDYTWARETETNNNTVYQEQLRQLEQRMNDILQKVQQTEQQMHQKVNQILERLEQTEQQMHQKDNQILERLEQTEQQMHQKDNQILERLEQTEQQTHQQAADQQSHQLQEQLQQINNQLLQQQNQIDNIIQTSHLERQEFNRPWTMRSSFKELLIPRLFIVLPNKPGLVDKDEKSSPLQFRLYYLCECGDHTMTEDTKEYHEIHLAEHPGYDLDNHKGLFDKYGLYLLTMLYMVKYGVIANGRVVPPLLKLKISKDIDMDQERLRQLINDMISYLEDTLHIDGSNMDSTANWEMNSCEFSQLKQYLKVQEGENIFGNLHSTTTQDRHCVWVCSKHQREYHDSTIQQLKEVIIANDGEYSEEVGNIKIKISSNTLAKPFYGAVGKVRWIQSLDNRRSLTALDLKLDFNLSRATSTAHVLLNLNSIDSLVLDFVRLLLTAGISRMEHGI
ncbi:hypothetical protein BGZ65_004274 [Modicella reniformis]|uniref:Uncharacterized protein n=1 Tax=Modicella reniformis TaxID=1440133 RepID=A0A9P6LZ06_9FUNG|nr:hypothetical protein BGZ65_004274 [Modicella reniformis]